MVADALTKGLTGTQFVKLRKRLGVEDVREAAAKKRRLE
jgi:hypothetical protein